MPSNTKTEVQQTSPSSNGSSATKTPEPAFGNGDLGRIQDILLGEHATRTQERISSLEKGLITAIGDLRTELSAEISKLNERIDGERDARTTALGDVAGRLKEESKSRSSADSSQKKALDKSVERITRSIDDAVAKANEDLEAARVELSLQIEQADADNRSYSVDRDGLAALLTSVAAEIASS